MTTAAEYRAYARECFESASDASSEEVRKQFLDIAELWLTAAARLDGNRVDGETIGKASTTTTSRQSEVAKNDQDC